MPIGRHGFALLNAGSILRRIYKGRHRTKAGSATEPISGEIGIHQMAVDVDQAFAERMVTVKHLNALSRAALAEVLKYKQADR